jgi:hypothetical protein
VPFVGVIMSQKRNNISFVIRRKIEKPVKVFCIALLHRCALRTSVERLLKNGNGVVRGGNAEKQHLTG